MDYFAHHKKYAQGHGPSDETYWEADAIFAKAMRRRNDRIIAGYPVKKRELAQGIRKDLYAFYDAVYSTALDTNGAGTLWREGFEAYEPASVELAVSEACGPAHRREKKGSVAQVKRTMGAMASTLRAAVKRGGVKLPFGEPENVRRDLQRVRMIFNRIVVACRKLGLHASRRIFRECQEASEDVASYMAFH